MDRSCGTVGYQWQWLGPRFRRTRGAHGELTRRDRFRSISLDLRAVEPVLDFAETKLDHQKRGSSGSQGLEGGENKAIRTPPGTLHHDWHDR